MRHVLRSFFVLGSLLLLGSFLLLHFPFFIRDPSAGKPKLTVATQRARNITKVCGGAPLRIGAEWLVRNCSEKVAAHQADALERKMKQNRYYSSCPHTDNSGHLWQLESEKQMYGHETAIPFVVVNIGANKGYVASEWLELFHPELGISPASLKKHFDNLAAKGLLGRAHHLCGACDDCKTGPRLQRLERTKRPLLMHAIEPNPVNVRMLREMYNMAIGSEVSKYLIIREMAMSNQSQIAKFRKTDFGDETGSLQIGNHGNTIDVKVGTLDAYVRLEGISHIDYLKIDTEGYDALVLEGAERLLQEGQIDAIEFEYHSIAYWSRGGPERRFLRDVVQKLDKYGFACYILGRDGATVQLTKCWNEKLEIEFWSNIGCVRKNSPLLPFLAAVSLSWK